MIRLLRTVPTCFLCAQLLLQIPVDAIVIRHDVPDSDYRVSATAFPALAYLPGEGHGVLIARDWVVTAAHAAIWRPIHELTISGALCGVEKVIIHPGYRKPPKAWSVNIRNRLIAGNCVAVKRGLQVQMNVG